MTLNGSCTSTNCHHKDQPEGHTGQALLETRTAIICALALVVGLVVGAASGVTAGIGAGLATNFVGCITVGLIVGLASGVVSGLKAAATLDKLVKRSA